MSVQRSVQQQNQLAFERLLATALRARAGQLPLGAAQFLLEKGIALESSAVVEFETAGYMLGVLHGVQGLVVTPEHQLFAFELELDESHARVICVVSFENVTHKQNFSRNNTDTGTGQGALAIEVLSRLNDGRPAENVSK